MTRDEYVRTAGPKCKNRNKTFKLETAVPAQLDRFWIDPLHA